MLGLLSGSNEDRSGHGCTLECVHACTGDPGRTWTCGVGTSADAIPGRLLRAAFGDYAGRDQKRTPGREHRSPLVLHRDPVEDHVDPAARFASAISAVLDDLGGVIVLL